MPSIPCWICPEGQRAGAGAREGAASTRQSSHGDLWVPQEWEEHCPPLAELDWSPGPSVAHPGHASSLRCTGHGRGHGPRSLRLPCHLALPGASLLYPQLRYTCVQSGLTQMARCRRQGR